MVELYFCVRLHLKQRTFFVRVCMNTIRRFWKLIAGIPSTGRAISNVYLFPDSNSFSNLRINCCYRKLIQWCFVSCVLYSESLEWLHQFSNVESQICVQLHDGDTRILTKYCTISIFRRNFHTIFSGEFRIFVFTNVFSIQFRGWWLQYAKTPINRLTHEFSKSKPI